MQSTPLLPPPTGEPCPHAQEKRNVWPAVAGPMAQGPARRRKHARFVCRTFLATFGGFAFRFDPATNRQIRTVKLRDVIDATTGELVTLYMRVDGSPAWDLVCPCLGAPVGFTARFRRLPRPKPMGTTRVASFEIEGVGSPFAPTTKDLRVAPSTTGRAAS